MLKKIIIYAVILLFCLDKVAVAQEKTTIKWYSLSEAMELAKKEPRPIILDVYTDWCTWCKHMDRTTFSQSNIASYINKNFYAAKFNAETLEDIEFKDKKYINRKIGRNPTHDLAVKILDGKLSYPSIVFYSRDGKKTIVPGYKEPKDIEPFLVFFAEDVDKTANINNFVVNYMFTFPKAFEKDHSIFKIDKEFRPDTLGKVEWMQPEEISKKFNKTKKPILLYVYTDWCISCKVMDKTTFGNKKLAQQINENYYPLKVNAASVDEIIFLNQNFKGANTDHPNEIVQYYFDNYKMPGLVILNDEKQLVSRLNGYLTSDLLLPLTEYCHKKMYKKMQFNDYVKTYNR